LGMPGPFNTSESLQLAKQIADNLGIHWKEISIVSAYEEIISSIQKGLGEFPFGVVNENIQARLRGLILMAYANLNSSLLLNTSNKSEFAVGYTTLYGDMTGGLCPIADLLKLEVYALAQLINKDKEI